MKKRFIIVIVLYLICIVANAQSSYTIASKDSLVIAENFINFYEGIDSVVVKNKTCKLKFSYTNPLFDFTGEDGYAPVVASFWTNHIKKITKNVYLLIGVGGDTSFETELNLIFIKKDKILKYYIVKSNNKRLRDITFEYLPKTNEVIIPIIKRYTPQNYIYDIDIKENKLDSIKALEESKLAKFHRYRLKIK